MAHRAPVDPAEAFLNAHASDTCDETFFQCGAVDLAVKLMGQYLYFHDSKIAVRILETEAYPVGNEVYNKKFHDELELQLDVKELFKLKGGILLAWSPSHFKGECKDLFITAGPPDTGDLVHIRSCEPILGLEKIMRLRKNPVSKKIRKNLLIGPTNVSEGVGAESWQNDPRAGAKILYSAGGVQLFSGTWKAGEIAKRGMRILSNSTYYGCEGTGSLYRFALITNMNYKYSEKCGGLQDWDED